jgi:hypothetical protein
MKLAIIILILVALIFILFVARGAFRHEEGTPTDTTAAKNTEQPPWADTIKGLVKSFQPTLKLRQKVYTASTEEIIPPDEKHAFRTAKFHLLAGTAEIEYKDNTPIDNNSPLKKMDNPQTFKLPQDRDPNVKHQDLERGSILAFKRGGKLTFNCTGNSPSGNNPCRVEVE